MTKPEPSDWPRRGGVGRPGWPGFCPFGRFRSMKSRKNSSKGLPGGAEFRQSLLRSQSVAEMLERLDAYFRDERVREAAAHVGAASLDGSEEWACDMYCQ